MNQENPISLLEHSAVYLDSHALDLTQVRSKNLFKPYAKPYLNTGMLCTHIWVRFTLSNSSQKPVPSKKLWVIEKQL